MFPYLSDLINYFLGTTMHLSIYTYGFIMVIAAISAFVACYMELKRKGNDHQIPFGLEKSILSIVLIIVLSTFAGSTLFHILDHSDKFINNPVAKLNFFNGLSFYGGLIFCIVAVIIYAHHLNIPYPHALDMTALSVLISYAIGRLGCQLSGDGCWGIVNVSPQPGWLGFLPGWAWGFQFPHNVINAGIPITGCAGTHCNILTHPVFPTSLYESFMALIAFIILWTIRKKITTHGWLFVIFLLYYSTSRFFIEFIRVNPKYSILGMNLSQAQYISIGSFVLGAALIWYFRWLRIKQGISPG